MLRLVDEIHAFGELGPGWDGETAEPAYGPSIRDATRFAAVSWPIGHRLSPTLHADGTVILESEEGTGSLSFPGDSTIVYAFDGIAPGRATFDAVTVPAVLIPVLTMPQAA